MQLTFRCPNGHDVPAGQFSFCPVCGSKLIEAEEPAKEAARSTPQPTEAASAPRRRWPLSNGWTVALGIVTLGTGLLAPWAVYLWRSGHRKGAAAAAGVLVLFVIAVGFGSGSGSGSAPTAVFVSTPTTMAAPTTTAPLAPAPTPKPAEQYELIVSQSSCQESPSNASVNCSIGIKNRGDTAGQPVVYADYQYNDAGESFEQSDNNDCAPSDDIPPGELGWVYFCHNYNALKHDVIRVAVTLNENAKSWPYVRVASPDDVNWPSG